MSDLAPLFDETFLHKIDRLSLVVRKRRAGHLKGARRSTRRGTSVEFADYRNYARGDDLRRIDWNVYARLEKPFIKLFEEEEDLAVHVLLDASRSMDWGGGGTRAGSVAGEGAERVSTAGPTNKWVYARRVAATLGYIALGSGDRLTVAMLRERGTRTLAMKSIAERGHRGTRSDARTIEGHAQSAGPRSFFGPARGKGQTLPLLRFLAGQQATGGTDLNRALRAYAQGGGSGAATAGAAVAYAAGRGPIPRRPGLAILISDLFSPGGYAEGFDTLLARGYEALLIQVLAPEEADPYLAGDLTLVDVESGHEQEASIDAGMRSLYRHRLAAWQADIQRWCGQRGVAYAPVVTDTPFDELILFHLRRRGWVR